MLKKRNQGLTFLRWESADELSLENNIHARWSGVENEISVDRLDRCRLRCTSGSSANLGRREIDNLLHCELQLQWPEGFERPTNEGCYQKLVLGLERLALQTF